MGIAKKTAGTVVVLLFAGVFALRPIRSNPALVEVLLEGGAFSPGVVAVSAALLFVLVALSIVRFTSRVRSGGAVARTDASARDDAPDVSSSPDGKQDDPSSDTQDRRSGSGDGDTQPTSGLLGGQGGVRNRSFEIEEEPPEVAVDDHLAYLREELGEDMTPPDVDAPVSEDELTSAEEPIPEDKPDSEWEDATGAWPDNETERMGEGLNPGDERRGTDDRDRGSERREADEDQRPKRREAEDEPTVPERCPRSYCEAAWTDRGFLGLGGGNYEVLEGGKQVRCTECEGITTLD